MKDLLHKINKNGGTYLALIALIFASVYLKGLNRIFCIIFIITALLWIISSLTKEKHHLLEYFLYLFGSSIAGIIGFIIYSEYWNNEAWLIAKIGFLAFVGFFFLASIVGVLISLYLIFNYFKTKKNN